MQNSLGVSLVARHHPTKRHFSAIPKGWNVRCLWTRYWTGKVDLEVTGKENEWMRGLGRGNFDGWGFGLAGNKPQPERDRKAWMDEARSQWMFLSWKALMVGQGKRRLTWAVKVTGPLEGGV